MTATTTRFDFVIFGATGFTGQYVVQEVARIAEEEGISWAIAGRSRERLEEVLKKTEELLGKDFSSTSIIVADVANVDSLVAMCQQANVLLNCVGPYRFYGEPVVKACVESGCHHLDISGEPQYLEKMQLNYDQSAKESKVYIIGACGFDSIPCDMGIFYCKDQFAGDLTSVETYLKIHSGPKGVKVHFTTWQSAIYGFAYAKELKTLRKSLFPTPLPKNNYRMYRGPLFYSRDLNEWCFIFPGSDKSVAYRSQRFNHQFRKERAISVDTYFQAGSFFHTFLMIIFGAVFGILANFGCGRKLLEKFPKFFSGGVFSHEGPTQEDLDQTSFTMTFLGQGYDQKLDDYTQQYTSPPNKHIRATVSGPEAGYVTTPICLIQAGLVVLKERERLPPGGGVLTAGAAFCKTTLINRLQKHGVHFSIK